MSIRTAGGSRRLQIHGKGDDPRYQKQQQRRRPATTPISNWLRWSSRRSGYSSVPQEAQKRPGHRHRYDALSALNHRVGVQADLQTTPATEEADHGSAARGMAQITSGRTHAVSGEETWMPDDLTTDCGYPPSSADGNGLALRRKRSCGSTTARASARAGIDDERPVRQGPRGRVQVSGPSAVAGSRGLLTDAVEARNQMSCSRRGRSNTWLTRTS